MNVEGSSFARCVRHPSQFFTGFCSSCLAERLSAVGSVERGPEIVEIPSSSVADSQRRSNEVRVRQTLLSLFQLDDRNEAQVGSDAHVDRKLDPLEDKHLKQKKSFSRWRFRGASKSGRFGDTQLDSRCDRETHDSSKGAWEKPRHSWDGSIMSKALTCSFNCLEEPQDGSRKNKRSQPEESAATDSDRSNETIDVSKVDDVTLVEEKPSTSNGDLGSLFRERQHEEFRQEINAMNLSRKKSHRWSRVWDWSITSPFRDFAKKRENTLERSFSGTLHEGQSESHSGGHPYGNGVHSSRINKGLTRNLNGSNGEVQRYRHDLQRSREWRFGRSRSVHYPSHGNIDNGLLRFYLTPMRPSRRSSNNGRMRSSRLFSRGILGHQLYLS